MNDSSDMLSSRQLQLRGIGAKYFNTLVYNPRSRVNRNNLYKINSFKPPRALQRAKSSVFIQDRKVKDDEEEPLPLPEEDDVTFDLSPSTTLVNNPYKTPRPLLNAIPSVLHLDTEVKEDEESVTVPLPVDDEFNIDLSPGSQLIHDMIEQYEARLLSEHASNNPHCCCYNCR